MTPMGFAGGLRSLFVAAAVAAVAHACDPALPFVAFAGAIVAFEALRASLENARKRIR